MVIEGDFFLTQKEKCHEYLHSQCYICPYSNSQ